VRGWGAVFPPASRQFGTCVAATGAGSLPPAGGGVPRYGTRRAQRANFGAGSVGNFGNSMFPFALHCRVRNLCESDARL